MEIDKTNGVWDLDYPTEIDDIAYKLYLEYHFFTHKNGLLNMLTQRAVRFYYSDDIYKHDKIYYSDAKLIIRKEKIEKILKRGNR